jgi:predicted site-specific integrase-resolvase
MVLLIKDITREFGVSDRTVRRWIERGHLKVITFAGKAIKPYRFDEMAVLRLIGQEPVRSLKTRKKSKGPAPINRLEDIKWD